MLLCDCQSSIKESYLLTYILVLACQVIFKFQTFCTVMRFTSFTLQNSTILIFELFSTCLAYPDFLSFISFLSILP